MARSLFSFGPLDRDLSLIASEALSRAGFTTGIISGKCSAAAFTTGAAVATTLAACTAFASGTISGIAISAIFIAAFAAAAYSLAARSDGFSSTSAPVSFASFSFFSAIGPSFLPVSTHVADRPVDISSRPIQPVHALNSKVCRACAPTKNAPPGGLPGDTFNHTSIKCRAIDRFRRAVDIPPYERNPVTDASAISTPMMDSPPSTPDATIVPASSPASEPRARRTRSCTSLMPAPMHAVMDM